MKKNHVKKLSLYKETVTNLESQDLKVVKGGYLTAYCDTDGAACTHGCVTYPQYLCDD